MSMTFAEMWNNGWAALRAYWYFRRATELGSKVRVWGNPAIRNRGRMVIHDRVRVYSTMARTEMGVGPDGLLEIGEGTSINWGVSIAATKLVKIGANCMIGAQVMMMDTDFHRMEPDRRMERPESEPIILEDNVWLAGRVIVLRGVTIGHDSVVGAGSVVARDIPPRSVAVGFPARVVQKL